MSVGDERLEVGNGRIRAKKKKSEKELDEE